MFRAIVIYSTENREQLSAPCQHATIFYVRVSLPSNTLFRSVTIAPWLVPNWNQLEPIGTNWNQPFQCVFSVWCRLHGCKASRLHASWPALAIWGWLCSRTKNSDLWNRLNVNVDFFHVVNLHCRIVLVVGCCALEYFIVGTFSRNAPKWQMQVRSWFFLSGQYIIFILGLCVLLRHLLWQSPWLLWACCGKFEMAFQAWAFLDGLGVKLLPQRRGIPDCHKGVLESELPGSFESSSARGSKEEQPNGFVSSTRNPIPNHIAGATLPGLGAAAILF